MVSPAGPDQPEMREGDSGGWVVSKILIHGNEIQLSLLLLFWCLLLLLLLLLESSKSLLFLHQAARGLLLVSMLKLVLLLLTILVIIQVKGHHILAITARNGLAWRSDRRVGDHSSC